MNRVFLEFDIGDAVKRASAVEEWQGKTLPFLKSKCPVFLGQPFTADLLEDGESMEILKQAYFDEHQAVNELGMVNACV